MVEAEGDRQQQGQAGGVLGLAAGVGEEVDRVVAGGARALGDRRAVGGAGEVEEGVGWGKVAAGEGEAGDVMAVRGGGAVEVGVQGAVGGKGEEDGVGGGGGEEGGDIGVGGGVGEGEVVVLSQTGGL